MQTIILAEIKQFLSVLTHQRLAAAGEKIRIYRCQIFIFIWKKAILRGSNPPEIWLPQAKKMGFAGARFGKSEKVPENPIFRGVRIKLQKKPNSGILITKKTWILDFGVFIVPPLDPMVDSSSLLGGGYYEN